MSKPEYKDLEAKRRHLRFLLADGEWHHRKNIEMSPRLVRYLCNEFPADFISSQRGYKLFTRATDEEVGVAIADLKSRMEHMRRRIAGMERALYNRQFDEGARLIP